MDKLVSEVSRTMFVEMCKQNPVIHKLVGHCKYLVIREIYGVY